MDELFHYGVKGMKWGVRRYQNKDGSLTTEGKNRLVYISRARRANRTKDKMDKLYSTLSDDDKRLLGDDEAAKEWLTKEAGEYVVKRFLKEVGDEPVAAMDIMTTTKKGSYTVAIMTNPKYRGKGHAYELAQKGVSWYDKNKDKLEANVLTWNAYQDNEASRKIAEKLGFKYNKKKSNKNWAAYDHK